MSSDLVPYQGGFSRQGSKALRAVQENAVIGRAQMETAEDYAAQLANRRIANGYELAHRTVQHAAQLNRAVTAVTQGNPGLEMLIKPIEEEAARCAGYIIYRYMTR